MATWEEFNKQIESKAPTQAPPAWEAFNKQMSERAFGLEASEQQNVDKELFKTLRRRGAPQDVLKSFDPERVSYLRTLGETAGKGLSRGFGILRGTTQLASPSVLFAAVPGGVTPSEAAEESFQMAKRLFKGESEFDEGVEQAAQQFLEKTSRKDEKGNYIPTIPNVVTLATLGFFNLFGDPAFEVGVGLKGIKIVKEAIKFKKVGEVKKVLPKGVKFKGVTRELEIPIGPDLKIKVQPKTKDIIIKGYKKRFPSQKALPEGQLSKETTDLIMTTRDATGAEMVAKFQGDDLVMRPKRAIGKPAVQPITKAVAKEIDPLTKEITKAKARGDSFEDWVNNIDRDALEIYKQQKIDAGEKFSFSDFTPQEFKSKKEWSDKIFKPQLKQLWDKGATKVDDIASDISKAKAEGKSFDEFNNDFLSGKTGLKFHITDNPNFKIRTDIIPEDTVSKVVTKKVLTKKQFEEQLSKDTKIFRERGIKTKDEITKYIDTQRKMFEEKGGGAGLMVTKSLDEWLEKGVLSGDRKFVAIIDTSKVADKNLEIATRGFGNEIFISSPKDAKVIKVVSIEEALKIQKREQSAIKTKSQLKQLWDKKVEVKHKGKVKVEEVPREQLPVGAGKEKVSRLEARIKNSLGKTSPEDIERLGLSTFKEMNKAENIAMASEYVLKNPDEALEVLKGNIDAPKGVVNNSILVAMNNLAKGDVNLALKLASLRSTRLGQELSILTELDKASPVKHIEEIIRIREKAITKKGKSIRRTKEKITKDIKKSIKKPDKHDWSNFINSIKC